MQITTNIIRYGKDEAMPETIALRAGPLQMRFENGDLRTIQYGEREIVRRIYAAVRDQNWNTIPAEISNLKLEIQAKSFRINFAATHHQNEIDFVWHGEIIGESNGTIRFTFDGEARSTFLRNRIGFCVLHPAELAGEPCRVRYANGAEFVTAFPTLVAAEQPVTAIHDLGSIAHEVAPGIAAEVTFSGDLFEMEDQRNWIDASYKTFCTPLHLPFPVEVIAGTRITQTVVLRVHADAPIVSMAEVNEPSRVILSSKAQLVALPPIGFGLAEHVMTTRECERLKTLRPSHLRVDLMLADSEFTSVFTRACNEAERLETPLEVALFFGDHAAAELPSLVALLNEYQPRIARWLIFDAKEKTTTAQSLQLARAALSSFGVPIGGGANADFYQLNQFRPSSELLDFVTFSMNPQTHAFDNASLIEALTAIPVPIQSAKHYFDNLPVVISPITLKPRFNPVATSDMTDAAGALPANVDVRQMSLFGAAWTLGAIKRLAESGVASLTSFETTGWRGVMETEDGSPLPNQFHAIPGAVFPLYHVLADVAEFAGGEVVATQSSDPLKVEAMQLQHGARRTLLLANLTNEWQTAMMTGIEAATRLRRLHEQNAEAAMRAPESFRAQWEASNFTSNEIQLSPFEMVRLDW
jgi:D-apionolactonase